MYNKVVLIGRLTAAPDLKYTGQDTAVANFTLAVDRGYTSQRGEKETDFIRIVVWRKAAENCAQYLEKGSMAAVEGQLQIRSYEDRQGVKRTIAEIVASHVVFLSRKQNDTNEYDENIGDADVPF
jgi:single-strand DNA-binding protein